MKPIWFAVAIFAVGIFNMNAASSISITSPAFPAGSDIPAKFTCNGTNVSLDPKTTQMAENSAPAGAVQGTSDFGKRNYGGPCPPSGTHRYFFKIFALDTKLDLKPSARRAELDAAMRGHILAQGELMARYSHK
ncbi:MAG: YbhB/YbcL family Raf kinase inhibitor-like protein [Verrucomicrobia bacterium]|nr:MAG: YbhB/YbcL family Raf kinase inhibitor-like protein [Verrucomicrobiota bacterium]